MKTIPLSLCIGLALVGSIACGSSKDNPSTVGAAGSGALPSPPGSGSGGTGTTYQGKGGSTDIFTPTGGAPPAAGTNLCTPGNTTTISGIVVQGLTR